MAGDWIVWEKGLPLRREVVAMAKALDLDRRVVACMCMEVWSWADGETTDGLIRDVGMDVIDEVVRYTGFAQAMAQVGWLRHDRRGLMFPNWDRRNTKSAKRRLKEAERKRGEKGNTA